MNNIYKMTVEYSPQYLKHLESLTEEKLGFDMQEMNRAYLEPKKTLYDEISNNKK